MSDFVVSARKYRPARFDEVVGQQHVSQTLKNALRQGRLAHAFLFCGPRGVGKTTNARILAKVLNCLDVSGDFEPCNACANCTAFNQNASFNIFELDAASNNKVENMHQLMEQVRVPPQTGAKKVYIIDEVHMLSQAAFNAFLKTLEEPPDYAIFILATTEKHKILPTILSRCQVYDFHRIRPADMVAHLRGICEREGIHAEDEALHLVAEKADGALRDALSIFDRLVSSAPADARGALRLTYAHAAEQLNVLDHATFFAVTDALLREDVGALYLLFDGVLGNGFEPEPFLGGLARHLRQLFVCKSPQTIKLLEVSEALRRRYAEQASLCGMGFLVNALNLAAECDFRLRQAVNKRLHVELYLVKMAYAARTVAREGVSVGAGALPNVAPGAAVAKTAVGSSAAGPSPAPQAPAAGPAPAPQAPPPTAVPTTTVPTARVTPPQPQRDAPSPLEPAAAQLAPEAAARHAAPAAGIACAPAEQQSAVAEADVATHPSPAPGNVAATRPKRSAALPSISFDDEDDDVEVAEEVRAADLTLEKLKSEWLFAAEDQAQRVKAVMRNAKLAYEAPVLSVRVGSHFAENLLRNEGNQNIREIKTRLHCGDLEINFVFDEALAPKKEVKAKPVGPKEQYQILLDANPGVDELRRKLKLKYEG